MSWYSNMPDDVAKAAKEFAGNWRRFGSFAWWGKPEHRPENCAIVYLENRDSDCVDQSNAAAIRKVLAPALGDLNDGDMAETCHHSHWAVGHVDGIVIRVLDDDGEPTWAFRKLHELAVRLDGYPVLDENDLSEREQAAADRVWSDCYNDRERIAYIRDHRREFEFHSFADMLSCVRGKYFAGYASELLG